MVDWFTTNKPFLTDELVDLNLDILRGEIPPLNPRKIDYLPNVTNCTNPYVYGGGSGAGRLWNDYLYLPKHDLEYGKLQLQIVKHISNALIPNTKWRNVARECIISQTTAADTTGDGTDTDESSAWPSYVALHARVEIDMITHKCGANMEKNLTKIINMVNDYVVDYNSKVLKNNQEEKHPPLDGIFIAVSRDGMNAPPPERNIAIQQMAKYNWKTLTRLSSSNHLDRTASTTATKKAMPTDPNTTTAQPLLFECGELWMDKWYKDNSDALGIEDDYYGSIVPSVMNFYLATQATIFVGVSKSSWSTDVWTTRYYQGKGSTNYEYTRESNKIQLLPNGGLPPPHKNC